MTTGKNRLFYGDNLDVLPEHFRFRIRGVLTQATVH
jgi:hypothetical protein